MIAIIRKELRENALWAVLAAVVLLGLAIVVGTGWMGTSPRYEQLATLSESTQMLSMTAFCVAGFVLGVAQVLQDTRRGRWGFVIHRPISRWKTFAAKVIAGWLMYLLATGAAIVALVIIARTPRLTGAPFAWNMTTLLFFAQAAGLLWHAAGMLVASRRAAWLGSRLFPGAAAAVMTAISFGTAIYFSEALAYLAAGMALLLVAAAAYFVHNGEYEPQPIAARPLQVLLVGVGGGCAMGSVIGLSMLVLSMLTEAPRGYTFNQYMLGRDGTAYRYEQTNTGALRYYDLSGKEVSSGTFRTMRAFEAMPMASSGLYDQSHPSLPRLQRLSRKAFYNTAQYLRLLETDGNAVRWYYVGARRLIEGHGYRGVFVGSIGSDGFHPPGEAAQPFDGPLVESYTDNKLIATRLQAYRLDIASRQIKPIFSTTADDPILGLGSFTDRELGTYEIPSDDPDKGIRAGERDRKDEPRQFTLVVTRSRVNVLAGTQLLFSHPLEKTTPSENVSVGGDGKTFYLLFGSYFASGLSSEVVRVDAQGKVLDRQTLPPLPGLQWRTPQRTEQLPLLFVPPALLLAAWLFGETGSPPAAELFPGWIVAPFIAIWLCSVLLTGWICRRYAYGRTSTVIWLLLSVAAGPGAAFTLWFIRTRPARTPCPQCGRKRVVTRDTCEHCGAPFDRPAAPAIEIFESAAPDRASAA